MSGFRGIEGKVAVVTGAGSGIGRATALTFAREGAKVVLADIQDELGEEVAKQINDDGGEAVYVHTDVTKKDQIQALMEKAVEQFGGVHIAANVAGIEGIAACPTGECTEENWDKVLDVNLRGTFECMKAEIPHMLKNGGGAIVNVASVAGLVGFAGLPAYCASKGGVVQLTRTSALEYAKENIRVNAVCPGVIWTPMVQRLADTPESKAAFESMEPVGRLGEPEEIAEAILWLASDNASFVTGLPMAVDGGFVAQ